MRRLLALLCLGLALPALGQSTPPEPDVKGYIGHVTSATQFEVALYHIQVGPKTTFELFFNDTTGNTLDHFEPYVGQHVSIYGRVDDKQLTVAATKIEIQPPAHNSVSGAAAIDSIPAAQPSSGMLLRADGYFLQIPATVIPTRKDTISPTEPIHANLWIAYEGVFGDNGVIVVKKATLYLNDTKPKEEKARAKTEYDPSTISPDKKQTSSDQFFSGIDVKKIPPWKDAAMQQRIERIGNSLIPAYQRALPESDPAHLDFRFQVIDNKWLAPQALPSGIILVPHHAVERMQTDDQLAAILADAIATILERQNIRLSTSNRNYTVTDAALDAGIVGGGVFVPGVALPFGIYGGIEQHKLNEAFQQSGRVSLCLLHDAGYDIAEAPEAWRLLTAKPGKDLNKVKYPGHSNDLFETIGIVWHRPPAP